MCHCMLDEVNYKLELMRNHLMKIKLWQWSRLLAKVDIMTAAWFLEEAKPIENCLLEFRRVKDMCFGCNHF